MTPRRPYARTGLNALKARVKVKGLAAIDKRTTAARALLDWRRELLSDLGGEATVSAAQRALVETAVRTRLYLDHVDACLLERPTLVLGRKRLIPLVEQRQRLAESLVRFLVQLGLERRARPVPALHDYVANKYPATGKSAVTADAVAGDGARDVAEGDVAQGGSRNE